MDPASVRVEIELQSENFDNLKFEVLPWQQNSEKMHGEHQKSKHGVAGSEQQPSNPFSVIMFSVAQLITEF